MMAATDLRGQLVVLRTRIRRRDMRGAEAMLDTLLAQATSNGHAPTLKLPPLRKASKAECPFGWKYTAKGKQIRDRRHTCGPGATGLRLRLSHGSERRHTRSRQA